MAGTSAQLAHPESSLTSEKFPPQRRGIISTIAYAPISIVLSLVYKTADFLRPFAPQIIPVIVCVLLVPLIVALSAYAGWVVWRSVPVAWRVPLNLHYGDGSQPYAVATISDISSQQPYDVALQLSVPATDANYALGNFMASAHFYTISNTTIVSVRRSAMILPTPASSLFMFSSRRKLIDVDIPLLGSYTLGFSRVRVEVEIGRRDRWTSLGNGEGRELSVYSASLMGNVRHRGLRGLASRFPLISALAASFLFLVVSLLVVGACILPMVFPGEAKYADRTPEVPQRVSVTPEFDSSSGADQKPPKSHRRTRTRRGSIRRMAVKVEESTSTLVPSGSESHPRPLRRRRSRVGEGLSDSDG